MKAKRATRTESLVRKAGIERGTPDDYAIPHDAYVLAHAIASTPGMVNAIGWAIEGVLDGGFSLFLLCIKDTLKAMPKDDCPIIRRVLKVTQGTNQPKTDAAALYLPENASRHI